MNPNTSLHSARAMQQQMFPVAGKIRAGIKVMTKATAAIAGAPDIYARGIRCGASFKDIEASLINHPGCTANPLTPSNVGYFRVCAEDFSTPGAAAEIMKRYAGPDGLLREFPVIFPSDNIDLVFRESFEAWNAKELVRWSDIDSATGTLGCMRRQDVTPEQRQSRRKHFWGGRKVDKIGPCDPNTCDLFGSGKCKHNGTLYFYVPGCPGVGVIELEFSSFYASSGIMRTLTFVQSGLGHIQGTYKGKPIFWISKVLRDVSRVDYEKGKTTRTEHWIITIDARGVDMSELFAAQENGGELLMPDRASLRELPPVTRVYDDFVPAVQSLSAADMRIMVIDRVRAMPGAKMTTFATRMDTDFGKGWGTNADVLRTVLRRLDYAEETGDLSELAPALTVAETAEVPVPAEPVSVPETEVDTDEAIPAEEVPSGAPF